MNILEVLLGLQLISVTALVAAADGESGCKALSCDKNCTYGFAIDVSGCPTCECKEDVCQPVTCSIGKVCKKFLLTNTNTEIARCVDPTLSEKCQQPMDSGVCKGSRVHWFFDTDTEQCQEFNYGGCPGNENNFASKVECLSACPPNCGDVMCTMYCEKGFKKDIRGCDICICEEETVMVNVTQDKSFNVDMGCDDTIEAMCSLHCPFGYQLDENRCSICKCNFPPNCGEKSCAIDCIHGLRTDEDGCPVCECREEKQCNLFKCQMYCEFGHRKNADGCELCECNPHPCDTFNCPDKTQCVLRNSTVGDQTPECLLYESWSSNCPSVTCMMHCEHGFKSDIRGCGVCECLDKPKEPCPEIKCKKGCEFGYEKNMYACDTCKCLPNPCDDKACGDEQVCETVSDCIRTSCTYRGSCSDRKYIKRVRVQVSFTHKKPLDKEHMDDFLKNVKKSFADILDVDEDQIAKIEANQDDSTVHVSFHVLGDGKDLVEAWKTAETHIASEATESAITYNGQQFIPQRDTLVSVYSSNAEIDPGNGDKEGSATTIIVIACAVVGAIILVVAGIVALYASKSKKKEKKRKNVIYKKAPEERSSDSLA